MPEALNSIHRLNGLRRRASDAFSSIESTMSDSSAILPDLEQYRATDELAASIAGIMPLQNQSLHSQLQARLDTLTKPVGSLGVLERIAHQAGMIQRSVHPDIVRPAIVLFAADHGITAAGVSAYPKDVTWQMVENICSGGAAISVFCSQNDIDLHVVDAGVDHDFGRIERAFPIIDSKVAMGTADCSKGPAMSADQSRQAMALGMRQAERIVASGSRVLGFGEMGIGNTSSASLLSHLLTGIELQRCTGRGTGLDDDGLRKKLVVLRRALAINDLQPIAGTGNQAAVLRCLACIGGFEIAAIAGAMLKTAELGHMVLIDGFIATAAYLVASALQPALRDYGIFCHCSDEHGHHPVLEWLGVSPLLQLSMRLGEGTGCALALPLLRSACAFNNQMASFQSASITGPA